MIPKTIHYCWFGGNPLPKSVQKCVKQWKRKCLGYTITEWNETNFDIEACPLYVRQAYAEKKWAFVTDYVRLKVVYENGGIYLDTDVELLKKPDELLGYSAYFGFEDGVNINTGHGFGAEEGHPIVKAMMDDYEGIPFIKEDGTYDTLPCPTRNTQAFLRCGLQQDNSEQLLENNVKVFPSEWFCPLSYETKILNCTGNTMSIHWFDGSWMSEEQKTYHAMKVRMEKRDRLIHTPQRVFKKILGENGYQKLKKLFKRG